nr:pyridoxal-phosphate dependent enzyme [Gemmatimonadota bacterium]
EDGHETAITEGAGTIALELARWPDPIETVLIPLGNGALAAGMGAWLRARRPDVRVVAVCAAGAPAMELSWRAGQPISTQGSDTIADGIAVREPVPAAVGDLRGLVDDVLMVSEAGMIAAMRAVFESMGLLVEPAGVVGIAAALEHRDSLGGELIATPLCGGNLTTEQVARWIGPWPC